MPEVRKIRLLVVEDNPAYLYLVQKAFSSRMQSIQWELMTAEDGEQALRLLIEEEVENAPLPQLILLDWNLPKVSGCEVLQRMKEHKKLRNIPILVFSASSEDEDIHNAYSNRANGYITKPDSTDTLATIVGTIEEFWTSVARLPIVTR
jgi:CheY-like chemotaxis protein